MERKIQPIRMFYALLAVYGSTVACQPPSNSKAHVAPQTAPQFPLVCRLRNNITTKSHTISSRFPQIPFKNINTPRCFQIDTSQPYVVSFDQNHGMYLVVGTNYAGVHTSEHVQSKDELVKAGFIQSIDQSIPDLPEDCTNSLDCLPPTNE